MKAAAGLSAVAFHRRGSDWSEDTMLQYLPSCFCFWKLPSSAHKGRFLFSCWWYYYYFVKAWCILRFWIPLLFYLMPQRVIHSFPCSVIRRPVFAMSLQYYQLADWWALCLMRILADWPCGSLDMYFQLYFLRRLNGFDVFIKEHRYKADIHIFILFRLWLMLCFSPTSKELPVILKTLVLNPSVLLASSRGKVYKLVLHAGLWFSLLW